MQTRSFRFPRVEDRAAWAGIDSRFRAEILQAGKALVNDGGYPALVASQFMAYANRGSRDAFETPYFARRNRLIRACLAYCVSEAPAALLEVVDGLWLICEESGWWVNAHHEGNNPLPDPECPIIDLFAAQTAGLVSWVCCLMESVLPPQVVLRTRREVERRLLSPFFARDDFWWMGFTPKSLNNWTPWILSNVLAAGHIWGVSPDARASMMLSRWLDSIPEDGGIDEGVAYWNMAGGSLLDCLEHLDALNRCAEPKIRALAAFPVHAYIAGDYFLNFADCDGKPHLDGERLYTFGKWTDNPSVSALGESLESRRTSLFPMDTPEFFRVLCRLFTPMKRVTGAAPLGDVTLPDLMVWIRRRGRLFVAMKGGHNAESHNHNDIGTFVLYMDGKPAILDAGNMTYTARTFRDETRYCLWNTRSANHNVPLIGTYEQAAGKDYCAKSVFLGAENVHMDIGLAYPAEAGVRSLVRSFSLQDGAVLIDSIRLETAQPVTWVFLLRQSPTVGNGIVRAGCLSIAFDTDLVAQVTAIPSEDSRLARSFPGTLYRLALTASSYVGHERVFRFSVVT